jgi:hypothetical protein
LLRALRACWPWRSTSGLSRASFFLRELTDMAPADLLAALVALPADQRERLTRQADEAAQALVPDADTLVMAALDAVDWLASVEDAGISRRGRSVLHNLRMALREKGVGF